MFNLFKTELLRHRTVACGVALFHFAVLYYLYTLGASVLRSMQATVWLLVCMGLAAGFGIFQMTKHKRDNDWIYLLHRPLPLPRIFASLMLAGSCISLLVAVLPLAAYVMLMDVNQMFGIEGRHYQAIPYAMAAALAAYGCGCFAVLSASRLGFLVVAMMMIFAQVATTTDLLISSVLLMIWGFMLARVAFKPDLSQPPRRIRTLLLTELPIQSGCLLLITALTAWTSSAGGFLSGTNRTTNPVTGSDDFVRVMSAKETMQFALEHSSHADARRLSQQVTLGETMVAGPVSFNRYPERGQLSFVDEGLILTDGKQEALWRFRHDVMLFEGRDTNTAALLGWLAPDGIHAADTALPDLRFDSVPWGTGDQYIISNNDIYQVTWQDRQVHHRYHSDDSDRFNNSLTLGENVSTLFSDTRLYIFATAQLRDPDAVLTPDAILDVPDTSPPDLRKLAVLPMRDGYLVSALLDPTPLVDAPDFASLGHARLELYRVKQGADAEVIANTALPSGAGEWSLYKDFALAPGIRLFNDFVFGTRMHASAEATFPLWYVQFPLKMYLAAVFVCLLCAGITAWLLRRSTLPLRLKVFWIIGNGITGCAGLFSFFIGYYWKRGDLLLAEAASTSTPAADTATNTGTFGYNN